MRMLKIAALTAASLGLAVSANAQTQKGQQGQQMCQQIWNQADTQDQGFVTGQQAQRMNQAMRTAQGPRTKGGAAGGAPGGKAKSGTSGQAERVTRQEFMSACQRNPQSFSHLRS